MYYIRSRKIFERRIDDGLVLIDSETDAIFHLNQLGERIWECMQRPVSKTDIVEGCKMVSSDTPLAILERDVERQLEHLLLRRIILIHSSQP